MAVVPSPSDLQSKLSEHRQRNVELYDGWAKTYDTDGNALPLVDDVVFDERVVPLIQAQAAKGSVRILEIGCGTGRNTVKLPQLVNSQPGNVIHAIDISEGMMNEARKKLKGSLVKLELLDFQTQTEELSLFVGGKVDIIISTLVLGHVELGAFFATVGAYLKPGGWAWVTSMHPSIGNLTDAGYTRSDGVKVRGVSANYGIEEIVEEARKNGLETEGEIVEVGVGDSEVDAAAKFGDRARKWAGYKIFVGIMFRRC